MNIHTVIQKTRNLNSKITNDHEVRGGYVTLDGEEFYRIANSHLLPEFFMSMTTSSDHWMFISSFGALTAGRKDPDNALFPYYSADKISDMAAVTGPKTIFRILTQADIEIWSPFGNSVSEPGIKRNLYKNSVGNKLIFEEVHSRFQLCFRYQWTFSHRFGFVRSCQLSNFGTERQVEVLDGLQNLMTNGIDQNFQVRFSNLGDAYKKSELLKSSGVGIYYLSSVPTDRAEPSEGLRSTVVWQSGLAEPTILLSDSQVSAFVRGERIQTETDVRGRRGCYFTSSKICVGEGKSARWQIVANINHDQTDVANLVDRISTTECPESEVQGDVARCQDRLLRIVSTVDGRQVSAKDLKANRHQSNVLFNVMRGGFPAEGYQIATSDFVNQVRNLNCKVFERNEKFLKDLPSTLDHDELLRRLETTGDSDLRRIGLEYLPFTFGRRHGDPTRPWNTFSISTLNEDDSPALDYQGNWRDIFQNWEALSRAYPGYTASMIFRFVNASTADGYNPYRVTKEGFDWESPDPEDPWANYGYWGDHQIIYLLKLLEAAREHQPKGLNRWLNQDVCRYANVPYRIRDYKSILRDSQNTVDFDFELESEILKRVEALGCDGKLLLDQRGRTCRVNLAEKLLVTCLSKLTNFVPGGGIWLNTQRPEWNDANNALVGRGLSMVTVCHLRRYFCFLIDWLKELEGQESFSVSQEVACLFDLVLAALNRHRNLIGGEISGEARKAIVDELSIAGSKYRDLLYQASLSGEKSEVSLAQCLELFQLSVQFLDDSIRRNRRADGLFHSYNLLTKVRDEGGNCVALEIEHLYEMLEGQVAVLSSGLLSPEEALEVLDQLRASDMYRQDQRSYLLYPDRELSSFMEKNALDAAVLDQCELSAALIDRNETSVLRCDVNGNPRFNGDLRNSEGLKSALADVKLRLGVEDELSLLIDQQGSALVQRFEKLFDHARFTGRSGTFFGYEGLGSIYWHMVSKLLLAVNENFVWACDSGSDQQVIDRLKEHARDLQDGIALDKSPTEYGAFPTDPYSHTPAHAGAQQPGMTGQVKEDILSRFMELGIRFVEGQVVFDFRLLDPSEFLHEPKTLEYFGLQGDLCTKHVDSQCLAFTYCQVPIVYRAVDGAMKLEIRFADGTCETREASEFAGNPCLMLSEGETQSLLSRTGVISDIEVFVPRENLS